MGLRPGLPLALLTGGGEFGGGFLIAAGLGDTARDGVARRGNNNRDPGGPPAQGHLAAAGGFAVPLLMLTSPLPVGRRNPPPRSPPAAGRSTHPARSRG